MLSLSAIALHLQVCHINLAVDEADANSVKLILGEARIETDKELTEYFITDTPESPTLVHDGNDGVNMKIIFKRRLTNEAMMTFFPSLLLIAISYATSFFRLPNFFNTAITVNLTVLLTVTTLLISVVKKLAQTSYIKWIEAWLIFAQLVPFTQVILITAIEWFREAGLREEEGNIKQDCWIDVKQNLVKVFLTILNQTILFF
jgi:hypothetical protein